MYNKLCGGNSTKSYFFEITIFELFLWKLEFGAGLFLSPEFILQSR